MEFNPF